MQERLATSEAAALKLKAAVALGDALTTTLAVRQQTIDQLSKEKRNALQKVTTGRACLGGPALRLLNTAPGLTVADLPPATGSAAAEDGAAASDTNIATWATDVGAQYETCRNRLDALIDWHGDGIKNEGFP